MPDINAPLHSCNVAWMRVDAHHAIKRAVCKVGACSVLYYQVWAVWRLWQIDAHRQVKHATAFLVLDGGCQVEDIADYSCCKDNRQNVHGNILPYLTGNLHSGHLATIREKGKMLKYLHKTLKESCHDDP